MPVLCNGRRVPVLCDLGGEHRKKAHAQAQLWPAPPAPPPHPDTSDWCWWAKNIAIFPGKLISQGFDKITVIHNHNQKLVGHSLE
jgi:hypothetical protein